MQKTVNAIQYPFAIDGGLGQLAIESDYGEHVEQLMKQVLFTNPGERINRPDFGCGIRRMVFAPNSPESASLAQVTIYQALEKWLGPLIKVDQVEVNAVEETLNIKIRYILKARKERRYLNVEVSI
jgi:phage baseplate assembly protein W